MAQIKTMKVGGGDYAKVADRLLQFRKENPRASVKTDHKINDDGSVTFSTFILKDKADEYSADSTGTASYSATEIKKPKAFEKLETISVGRALSLLGYLNNGEIATGEEMEEFHTYVAERHEQALAVATKELKSAKTLDELRNMFINLPSEIRNDKKIAILKNELKRKLEVK